MADAAQVVAVNGRVPDRFEFFEAFCRAAGIAPGAERLGVLLALPKPLRADLWSDVAARVQEHDAGP